MSNIDALLRYEEAVIADTRRFFDQFSPKLIEAFDMAIGMYTTFGRIIGQDTDMDSPTSEYNAAAQALGAKDRTELDTILAVPPVDAREASLRAQLADAMVRLEAHMDRGLVFLMMGRAFSRSVADLLRQRLTAAIGYQRPIVEGLALLFLTRDDPSKAIEWRKVVTDADGRAFHKRHQKGIESIIQAAELTSAYNNASGVSLHLRFAGAIGLDFDYRRERSRSVNITKLLNGELRPGQEFFFMTEVVGVLDTQARVFAWLDKAVPEARDPVWKEQRVPAFVRLGRELHARLSTAFPRDVARLKRRAAMGLIGKA